MHRYRKRPIEVEAFQMTEARRWDNNEWPNWLNEAWNKGGSEVGALWCDQIANEKLYIVTLEGSLRVAFDDWIIQGVQGELCPCKPDIFEATYEPVEEAGELLLLCSRRGCRGYPSEAVHAAD